MNRVVLTAKCFVYKNSKGKLDKFILKIKISN